MRGERLCTAHTCWSHLTTELVTSTKYMAVIKSLHSPPPSPLFLPLTLSMQRGEEGVRRGRGRLCLCVGGRGVSGGGEGGCLFEDSGCSPCLVSPAWLFEAVRWPHRATSPQVGGGEGGLRGRVGWGGGMEACHLYTAVSFILSTSPPPPPPPLSLPLPSPLLFLCCCCFAPS